MPRAKKEPAAPLRIVCDHRERAIIARLRQDPEVIVEETVLEFGDFEVAPGLYIERKAASDLCVSIVEGRATGQFERAAAAGVKLILLIEGDPFKLRRLHRNALLGFLSYVTVLHGMSAAQVPDEDSTCWYVKRAASMARDGLGYELSMRGATPKTLGAQQLFLVEGLPSIGRVKARELLKARGTVRRVFTALPSEITAIPGFGDGTAESLARVMDTPYVDEGGSGVPGRNW